MWRSLCAVVLLPAFAAAQTESGGGAQRPVMADAATPQAKSPQTANPQPAATQAKAPAYRAFTNYRQIRRGSSEMVAIDMTTQGLVTLSGSPVPGIEPIRLELQPEPGFTFGQVRYPKARKHQFPFRSEPMRATAIDWWSPIQFKLRASKTVALGEHTLKGTLMFQTVSDKGASEPQTVDVQIPVTVVEHDADVKKADYPHPGINPGWIVLMIVLLPIEIPIAIGLMTYCGIRYGTPLCND
jgi:hypothetical protein